MQIVFRPVEHENVVLQEGFIGFDGVGVVGVVAAAAVVVVIVVVITVVSSRFQFQASCLHPFHAFLPYRRPKLPRERECTGCSAIWRIHDNVGEGGVYWLG